MKENESGIGLDVEEEQFRVMPQDVQITILYSNVKEIKCLVQRQNRMVNTMSLDKRFHRKIIYAWLAALTSASATAFLFLLTKLV